MRNYMEEYQRWLDSPALSNAEWEELNAIRDDKKEIESRFFAPLEFGTAGLRGEMALGCRRSEHSCHPPRHAGVRGGHQGRGRERVRARHRHLL
ncbi:MAG: hypothetical protein ACLSHG_13350 [Oscillospiraceae bacterium]